MMTLYEVYPPYILIGKEIDTGEIVTWLNTYLGTGRVCLQIARLMKVSFSRLNSLLSQINQVKRGNRFI